MAEQSNVTAGVPRESFPGEARVAIVPTVLPALAKAKVDVIIEAGAGLAAGFPDQAYAEKGAKVTNDRKEVFAADVVLQVRTFSDADGGLADPDLIRPEQIIIGMANPLANPQAISRLAERKATAFAMELIPRITRAQSMDVLSSQANIGGYKAVLLAAEALPKMLPMMTTAAGTIRPAKVFILGVGVAGLQAIATAKRLGAVVEAFDVRPEVKEQVQSLGAKFIEVELDAAEQGTGGYAKQQSEEFLAKQRELMTKVIAASDVVITTAQVPGAKAPVLMTEEMVKAMAPGSVIVDMAAGQGGNVEPSRPDEKVVLNDVTILGPTNLPSTVAYHASAMFAKNISTFLLSLVKEGRVEINQEDEIVFETLMTKGGDVVHPRLREALGLQPVPRPEAPAIPEETLQSPPSGAVAAQNGAGAATAAEGKVSDK